MSGTREDRPQYQALLARVRQLRTEKRAVVVVVAALDLFGRRMLDTQTMLDSLVELVATTAELQDAAGRFVASGPPLKPERRW